MDDPSLIAEIGHALWGEHWQGPMADALNVRKATVGDWRRGRMPVPHGAWSELRSMAARRRAELDHLGPRILRAHDAAVAREAARPKRES